MIDALLMAVDIISEKPGVKERLHEELRDKGYEVGRREYILVTGHRRENFGEGFLHICKAIKELAALHPDMDIVYPVHLNPNVQNLYTSFCPGWIMCILFHRSIICRLFSQCNIPLCC